MIEHVLTFFRETPDLDQMVFRHLQLSFLPVLVAALIAIPLGLFIGHARRAEFVTVSLANLGRAVPSFAILSLALIVVIEFGIEDFGFWSTVVALFFLALPPIVVNTHAGVKSVDSDLSEAATGQGLSGIQVLGRLEIPLAVPLIVAGLRTASVQSVATATLGGLVAAGGLGTPILFGFSANDTPSLLGGAFVVALLAIGTEALFAGLERAVRPKGEAKATTVRPVRHLAEARRPPAGPSMSD